ncbi:MULTISPECIES: hypothetical protein [unclassified Pseudomonas]|uniref:hypothetical protein n=1 Tax=unclassified Pseudomonas TaxID=196821 RepID=UPI00084A8ED3|nr:hypothetical protein [Pseudomonas sp. AP42]OEC50638.1 hypothetical protein A7K61_23275 [Pseudomonas sp. AP42]
MKKINVTLLVALALTGAAKAKGISQIATDDETFCRSISALARSAATEKLKGTTYEALAVRSKSALHHKSDRAPKIITFSFVEAILKGVWALDPVFTPDRVGKLYYLNCMSGSVSPT